MLPRNLVSPLYEAVMECEPAVSAEVLKLAWPELSGTVASTVDPSRKVMVPVAAPAATTFTVNVTDWPNVDGLSVELTIVLVLGLNRTNGLSEVTVPHTVLVLKSRDEVTSTSVPFSIWNS